MSTTRQIARKFFTIGITGGIASGKSSVRKILGDVHNATVIDADKLGHACYVPGHPCLTQVLDAFGRENLLNEKGNLDRGKLGGIVFSDPMQMQKLNGIVWPHIRTALNTQLREIQAKAESSKPKLANVDMETTIVVVEAAVLLEAKWGDLFDEVWVVYVDPDIACQRLMARNNLSLEEAKKRQASQM
jgi:phosphopantetheine adenylyltransferase/dephospho-CoA kinase